MCNFNQTLRLIVGMPISSKGILGELTKIYSQNHFPLLTLCSNEGTLNPQWWSLNTNLPKQFEKKNFCVLFCPDCYQYFSGVVRITLSSFFSFKLWNPRPIFGYFWTGSRSYILQCSKKIEVPCKEVYHVLRNLVRKFWNLLANDYENDCPNPLTLIES